MFVKSIDVCDFMNTCENIFELLDALVEDIKEENVDQVISDNGSNYISAGKMLMDKIKHLYWTPCASNWIDLMVDDNGKLSLITKTIKRTINTIGYICNHSSTLKIFQASYDSSNHE